MSNSQMLYKRSVGRPTQRPEGETGYDAVVHATQQYLRSPDMSLNRRGIAAAAGVSPALVTYYFGQDGALLRDASEAIVLNYLKSIRDILQADDLAADAKLRAVVLVALTAGRRDGRLIDRYFDYLRAYPLEKSAAGLAAIVDLLNRLRSESTRQNIVLDKNGSAFWTAIWGACKYIAQTEEIDANFAQQSNMVSSVIENKADFIIELFFESKSSIRY